MAGSKYGPRGQPIPSVRAFSEECERAWQHALHEENVFNDRLNFFLLAEAMLLVFHAEVIGKVGPLGLVLIGALGVVITLFWVIINRRQIGELEDAKAKLRLCLPDYRSYDAAADSTRRRMRRSAAPVLGYWVPAVVAAIWVALIVDAVVNPRWPGAS